MLFTRNVISLMTLFIFSLVFSACSIQEDAGDVSGDESSGEVTDNGQTGQDIAVDDFKVSFDTNSEYTIRWHSDSNNDSVVSSSEVDTPCVGVEDGRTQCIMDIDELDLWIHPVTINVELPGDTNTGIKCAYLRQKHYYFSKALVSEMPYKVYYDLDDEGLVTNTKFCFPSNPCPDSSTNTYDPGNAPGITRPVGFWPVVDAEEDVKCPWDYTAMSVKYKNCCVGDYTKVITSSSGTEEVESEWGGSLKDCIAGPAVEDELPKISGGDYDGFPQAHITEVVGSGYGTEYTIPARDSGVALSDLFFANFFVPSDHTQSDESCGSVDSEISDGAATCALPIGGLSIGGMGYPFYTFECLNHNNEIVSRIDVMIREWNTKAQLLLGASGNPDVEGVESSPFASRPNNDYCDWKDFANNSSACRGYDYSHFHNGRVFVEEAFTAGD